MTNVSNGLRCSLLVAVLASVAALATSGGCGDCDLRVETAFLPDGFVGEPYDDQLRSDCGGDAWFLEEGNLPPGVQLQQNGRLRGTPTRRGDFVFTVSVIDVDGFDYDYYNDVAFQGLSITIN